MRSTTKPCFHAVWKHGLVVNRGAKLPIEIVHTFASWDFIRSEVGDVRGGDEEGELKAYEAVTLLLTAVRSLWEGREYRAVTKQSSRQWYM